MKNPHQKSLHLYDIVREQLASGAKTTEELRVAMKETYPTAYHVLRVMREDGEIQSSNPRTTKMRKWRLTPCTKDAASSTSSSPAS